MITFTVTTPIRAPIESCFDFARDIGFHVRSLAHTGERAEVATTFCGPQSNGAPSKLQRLEPPATDCRGDESGEE